MALCCLNPQPWRDAARLGRGSPFHSLDPSEIDLFKPMIYSPTMESKNQMNDQYSRLITLAEELDTPSSPARIDHLNYLLSEISVTVVKSEHFSLLDDLISTMSVTGNIATTHEAKILQLLEDIRSRGSA